MGNFTVSALLVIGLAATLSVAITRRKAPRVIELFCWVALVWVCFLAVTKAQNADARALTSAVFAGASQIVGTVLTGVGQEVAGWFAARRFAIANLIVIVAGADVLALALIASKRRADSWKPRFRLRDWMELPLSRPALAPAVSRPAVSVPLERLQTWSPALALMWVILMISGGSRSLPATLAARRPPAPAIIPPPTAIIPPPTVPESPMVGPTVPPKPRIRARRPPKASAGRPAKRQATARKATARKTTRSRAKRKAE